MRRPLRFLAGAAILAAACGDPAVDLDGTWELDHVEESGGLVTVWGAAPDDVWAAGGTAEGGLVLHGDGEVGGRVEEPTLGPGFDAGKRPQIVVPAGTWQGSSPAGAWSLVGTTMAPPFAWSGFRLGKRAELLDRWPSARARITALTCG